MYHIISVQYMFVCVCLLYCVTILRPCLVRTVTTMLYLAASFAVSVLLITRCFCNFQLSFGFFISPSVRSYGPKHVWGRAVWGRGAHVTRLVWFSSAPLWVLLFILPHYSFLCFLAYLFIFPLSLSSSAALWNSQCLFRHHLFNSRFVSWVWLVFWVFITLMLEKTKWSDAVWKFPSDGRAPNRTILQCP